MAWNFTETATTSIDVGSGYQLLSGDVADLFQAGFDEVINKYSNVPVMGSKYHAVKNVDMNNIKTKSMLGIGLMKVNSDADEMPFDKMGVGFEQTITNYVLRVAMGTSREAIETDRYGAIGKDTRSLMHSAKRTIEYVLADSFNRGFGTTNGITTADSNLSLLAEDGLALFSGSRPQPRASAGTWSNLDSGGVLSEDAIFSNITAGRTYVDGNGDLDPQELVKIIVAPNLEQTIKIVTKSSLSPTTSLNDANSVMGLQYEVYSWLSDGIVIYEFDGENELEFHVRKSPEIMTWQGENPDLIKSRCRMAIGTGCKRPGKFRGCQVS